MAASDPGPPPKRRDYLTQDSYQVARELWQMRKKAWQQEEGGSERGSTMYDRRARRRHTPTAGKGQANLGTGEGHFTQAYDDGYRLSRDTDGEGDSRVHWTDQNQPKDKKHKEQRHSPPPDARD